MIIWESKYIPSYPVKKLLLSSAIAKVAVGFALSVATPVLAEWNGLSNEQIQSCVDEIYNFELLRYQQAESILTQFSGSRGYGRDLAVLYAQYKVDIAYSETKAKCGGEYNMQSIAYQMYKQNYISNPNVSKYLGVR